MCKKQQLTSTYYRYGYTSHEPNIAMQLSIPSTIAFPRYFLPFFALFWKGWNKFGLKSGSAHDTSGDVEASNTILNKD